MSRAPARLHVLFDEPRELDLSAVAARLAEFSPALEDAIVELLPELGIAAIRFGEHSVQLRASADPLPEVLVDPSIQLAHYGLEDKARARGHRCYVALEHAPSALHPIAELRATALAAATIAPLGGIVVLNLAARTSVPVGIFEHPPEMDMVAHVESLPPLVLFMGLAKYGVDGTDGIWMRTHGGPALGVPDFARLAASHAEGLATFTLFNHAIAYSVDAAAELTPGDVLQAEDGLFFRLRAPSEEEGFLEGEGTMLVVENVEVAES